jgi:hypothetical protein
MKKIRNWIFAILFVASTGGATLAIAMPQTTMAACNPRPLLTFPAWYRGLTKDDCTIKSPTDLDPKKGLQIFIWTIVLNIIEIMLQLVGYISVGFIIYGGFKFITGTGTPDTVVKARTTILNAVIGLVLSIASIGIVNVIAGAIQ